MEKKDLEKMLAEKMVKGDSQALKVFYNEYSKRLAAYVRGRVSVEEDVEELVQDTFLGFST